MFDGKAFGEEMAAICRAYVDVTYAPVVEDHKALTARVAELEKQLTEAEKTFTLEAILAAVGEKAPELFPVPEVIHGENGKDADPAVIKQLIDEAVAAIPTPQDGVSPELPDIEAIVQDQVRAAVAAIEKPKDGISVDPDEVRKMVSDAVGVIPVPKDGISPTLPDIPAIVAEEVERALGGIPVPKDGVGVAGAVIDRDGSLILTLSDGTTRELGQVVGRDGEPGKAGETFTLDDFDLQQYDDRRTFKFCFQRGEYMHSFEFALPVPLYRGVFKDGQAYEIGDMVTWAGSLWHCDNDTTSKPGEGTDDWTLSVKKGRDGRDKP